MGDPGEEIEGFAGNISGDEWLFLKFTCTLLPREGQKISTCPVLVTRFRTSRKMSCRCHFRYRSWRHSATVWRKSDPDSPPAWALWERGLCVCVCVCVCVSVCLSV